MSTLFIKINDTELEVDDEGNVRAVGDETDASAADLIVKRLDETSFHVLSQNQSVILRVEPNGEGAVRVASRGSESIALIQTRQEKLLERYGAATLKKGRDGNVKAPMPGLVLRILVEEGQEVRAGEGLVVLEAMKMENELVSPIDGVVKSVNATVGEPVEKSALLVAISSSE